MRCVAARDDLLVECIHNRIPMRTDTRACYSAGQQLKKKSALPKEKPSRARGQQREIAWRVPWPWKPLWRRSTNTPMVFCKAQCKRALQKRILPFSQTALQGGKQRTSTKSTVQRVFKRSRLTCFEETKTESILSLHGWHWFSKQIWFEQMPLMKQRLCWIAFPCVEPFHNVESL